MSGSDESNKLDDPFARIAAALSEEPAPGSRRPPANGRSNQRRSRPSYSDGDSLQVSGESIPQPAHQSNDPALPTVIVAADPTPAFVRRSQSGAPTVRGRVRGAPILQKERRISPSTVLLLLAISLVVFAGGILMFVMSRKPANAHPPQAPVSTVLPPS